MERKTMNLICDLSEDEIRDRAFEAGNLDLEIEVSETNFDVQRKEHKVHIEELEAMRTNLLREIRTKQTSREVECVVESIYHPAFVVRTTRTDTGEIVHERSMTPDERQGNFFAIEGERGSA